MRRTASSSEGVRVPARASNPELLRYRRRHNMTRGRGSGFGILNSWFGIGERTDAVSFFPSVQVEKGFGLAGAGVCDGGREVVHAKASRRTGIDRTEIGSSETPDEEVFNLHRRRRGVYEYD